MDISPQEMRAIKEDLDKLESMAIRMGNLSHEMMEEVDIAKRRLAFINHPAGRARETLNVSEPLNYQPEPTNLRDYKANKEIQDGTE